MATRLEKENAKKSYPFFTAQSIIATVSGVALLCIAIGLFFIPGANVVAAIVFASLLGVVAVGSLIYAGIVITEAIYDQKTLTENTIEFKHLNFTEKQTRDPVLQNALDFCAAINDSNVVATHDDIEELFDRYMGAVKPKAQDNSYEVNEPKDKTPKNANVRNK
jgi:hypothetical protein